MNTTKTFLRKSSQIVIAVAVSLQLSQCDSSTDLTVNPNANFDVDNRYIKDDLDANLGATVAFPASLLSGEEVILEDFIDADENIESQVRSSGQVFIENFRFNFSKRSVALRDISVTRNDEAIIYRSSDHLIEDDGEFVSALAKLQQTSTGIDSLKQALLIDQTITEGGLVGFTNDEVRVILNAIKSQGHTAEIEDESRFFRVLTDQHYRLTATSSNQLLVDEQKITGNVLMTKFWRQLLFESEFDENGNPVSDEWTIILGDSLSSDIILGTFEIQLNSL